MDGLTLRAFLAGVVQLEIGDLGGKIPDGLDVFPLERLAAQYGDRKRHVLCPLLPVARGHHDFTVFIGLIGIGQRVSAQTGRCHDRRPVWRRCRRRGGFIFRC